MAKKKIKILMIDDEKEFSKMVKLNLEGTKRYEVRTESKGSQGFAAVRAFRPDVILLDVIMPDMSGGEVARQIRDDETTKHIPIVFLTATVLKEEAESQGGIIGGNPFIAKPASADEIIECIEKNIKN